MPLQKIVHFGLSQTMQSLSNSSFVFYYSLIFSSSSGEGDSSFPCETSDISSS